MTQTFYFYYSVPSLQMSANIQLKEIVQIKIVQIVLPLFTDEFLNYTDKQYSKEHE